MSDSNSKIQSNFLEHNLRDTGREEEPHVVNPDTLPSTSKEANDQYLLGYWYLRRRQYALALNAYQRALERDPDCAAIHHSLGFAYYKEGEFESARAAFQKAISLNPLNANYHYVFGHLQQDDEAWDEAIYEFSRTIELAPSYVEAWYDRGLLYDKRGEFEKACDNFKQVIELKPDFEAARHNLGVLYIKRQMWAAAKQVFEEIHTIAPKDADAHYHLAEVYMNLSGDTARAIDSFKRAIQRDLNHLDARFGLGILYAKNRYDRPDYRQQAIDQFLEIIKQSDILQDFNLLDQLFFILGSLYDDQPEDADLAIAAYRAGLEHSPSAPVRNNLGLLYLQQNQPEHAAEEFRQAIQLDPDYEAPYYNLAKLYFYERDEEFSKDLQQWLARHPQKAAPMITKLSISLMDVARAEAYQSLYSRLHRVKNLISVGGVQLRSILRHSDNTPDLHNKLNQIFAQHEDSYDEMVSLLQALRREASVFGLVNVNKILELLLTELEPVFKSKRIECHQELAPHLPSAKGDSSQLKEAFHNLIINAIDAMKDGGFLKLQTIYQPEPPQLQISFIDTGVGIPDALQNKIFQPGYSLKQNGSGFGLNIVQQTVRDHKGRIEWDSKHGCGATFMIYLPVDPEAAPIKTNLQMRPILYEAHHDLAFEELV
jgi:signal transduction histidine kinase